ncbi:hypothetical protein I7I48_07672 [Histoplasma ohiense]|nr:hypothetical protein I7I48_07672 [Histoplasma ohiense (nom. inval.)]
MHALLRQWVGGWMAMACHHESWSAFMIGFWSAPYKALISLLVWEGGKVRRGFQLKLSMMTMI